MTSTPRDPRDEQPGPETSPETSPYDETRSYDLGPQPAWTPGDETLLVWVVDTAQFVNVEPIEPTQGIPPASATAPLPPPSPSPNDRRRRPSIIGLAWFVECQSL